MMAIGKRARWLALGILVLAVLLLAVDATVLALAIPALSADLHPTSTEILWIGDIYSFVIAGLLVTIGSLGDRIGRKRLLLIGAVCFAVLSVVAAYTTSASALIVARALLGVAGATLMPSTLSLLRHIFPDKAERQLAIGIWGAAASAGAAFGPLVGGVLLEHFWWGSVFLINVPVMVLLLAIGIPLLPEARDPNPGRFDLPSSALSLVGVIGVVYLIKEVAAHGPGVTMPYVAGAVGLTALWLFARRQLRLAAPMFDVRLFAHGGFTAAIVGCLLALVGLSGVGYFMSQFFQLAQGLSPLYAGLRELPLAVGSIAGGVLAAQAAKRLGDRRVIAGGLLGMALALSPLILISADVSYLGIGVPLLLVGLFAGLTFSVTENVVLTVAPPDKSGAAAAVSETAYELGAALGIALLGSALNAVYRAKLVVPDSAGTGASTASRESLAEAIAQARELPDRIGEPLLASAKAAFVDGINTAATLATVLLLAAAVLTWRLLRTKSETPVRLGSSRSR